MAEPVSSTAFAGRVWRFGDDINTDLVIPGYTVTRPIAEQATHTFEANRPGWVDEVRPGDVIVAGRNFGVGGGRAIGSVFRIHGLAGVVAGSFNGLGLRNCVNAGLPVLPCPGVDEAFAEGDVAEVDWASGAVRNATTGVELQGRPLPPAIRDIVLQGGVEAILRREGFLGERDPAMPY
jgi:3-isopropylmalate/(R)-2-methylmalate dehydratase small subunit